MAAQMPSTLLTEWMCYYDIDPFGEERADLRSGIVAATIANTNRDKKDKPHKVEDFMPKFEAPEEQTPEQMIQVAAAWTAALGGEVNI